MKLSDFRFLIQPRTLTRQQRIRFVVYLAVVGFAGSLFAWMGLHRDPFGPAWTDALMNNTILALAASLSLSSLLVTVLWMGLAFFDRATWLLVVMGFIMNAILLSTAVSRPEDYENMAAGILAALFIAVATTQPSQDNPTSLEEE